MILYFIFSLLSCYIISFVKSKEKIKDFLPQHYSKKHISRKGGLIIGSLGLISIFQNNNYRTFPKYIIIIICAIMFFLGFLDDLLKKTKGLSSIFRIICWLLIGSVLGFLRYKILGSSILLPILGFIDIGLLYLLLGPLFFVGVVNSVNMTDGLDGLVSFPLILNFIFFYVYYGLCLEFVFIVLGFLLCNFHRAKILMGDSGSIFLGTYLGIIFMITKLEFFFPILGFVFTVNFCSSFIQIFSIRFFNKKVFKIAPIHHHLELIGLKEPLIVFIFWIIALISMLTSIFIYEVYYLN